MYVLLAPGHAAWKAYSQKGSKFRESNPVDENVTRCTYPTPVTTDFLLSSGENSTRASDAGNVNFFDSRTRWSWRHRLLENSRHDEHNGRLVIGLPPMVRLGRMTQWRQSATCIISNDSDKSIKPEERCGNWRELPVSELTILGEKFGVKKGGESVPAVRPRTSSKCSFLVIKSDCSYRVCT